MRFDLFLSTALVFTLAAGTSSFAEMASLPEAAPAAAVAPVASAPAFDHHLTANRFVLATHVMNREPEGVKEHFSVHDGHIYAFADLSTKGNDHVIFRWKRGGAIHSEVQLAVKDSARYRVFSNVVARPGSWSVELVDSHGTVIKELSFTVEKTGKMTDVPKTDHAPEPAPKTETVKGVLESLEPARESKPTK